VKALRRLGDLKYMKIERAYRREIDVVVCVFDRYTKSGRSVNNRDEGTEAR
jgi:hypothetical protein